jgi:hypothetical protein
LIFHFSDCPLVVALLIPFPSFGYKSQVELLIFLFYRPAINPRFSSLNTAVLSIYVKPSIMITPKSILPVMLLATATAAAQSTVYLIRHGEKPSKGNGLTTQGEQRAQCLVNVFAASSSYNIGHIIAQTPQSGM